MKKLCSVIFVLFFFSEAAWASSWINHTAPSKDVEGATVYIASTTGKRGNLFAVVCDDRGLAIDLEMRGKGEEAALVDIMWKVDRWPRTAMTGETFLKEASGYFLTFYDASSAPLVGTETLVHRVKKGNRLRAFYAKSGELLDDFSLKGSLRVLHEVEQACEAGLGKAPEAQ